jgi:hypothetical protein
MGLSFTITAGPRQRSHSQVRAPRDPWPYFTVSDSRLTEPRGPGPRIYIPQEQGGPDIPQALGSLFVASYDSQGYGGGMRPRLHTGVISSYSHVYDCEYRRVLDWWLDLLESLTQRVKWLYNSPLLTHTHTHTHTHTLVSTVMFSLAVAR